MNKKVTLIVLITIGVLFTACGNKQVKTEETNNIQNNATKIQPSNNTNTSTNADNTNNTMAANTVNTGSNTSAQSSTNVYTKYSGTWIDKDTLKTDRPFGRAIDINIDKDDNLKGVVSNLSNGFAHVSNVNIAGKIENDKFTSNFNDDGWGHSGTIELEFKNNEIICVINYDAKSLKINSDWGISYGTFNLVNSNTPISRTITDLRNGGWNDISNQCFDVNLNKYGKVKFITETNFNTGLFNFYLEDGKGNIAYKFPVDYRNDIGPNSLIEGVSAISVRDVNNDGLKDVIVLFNGTDSNKNVPISICIIFSQKNNGVFIYNKSLSEKVNKSGNNKDIKSVLNSLK